MKSCKPITKTAFCLLASLVAIAPVQAHLITQTDNIDNIELETPPEEPGTTDRESQNDSNQRQEAARGRIISIVGNLVEVQLDNSEETVWINVSQADLRRFSLKEGLYVALASESGYYTITGIASSQAVATASSSSSDFRSRTAALWREYEASLSRQRTTTVTAPITTQQEFQQPAPPPPPASSVAAPEPEPVRALW